MNLTAVHAAESTTASTLIGAGVWARPAYLGSDDKVLTAIPLLRYYGDGLFARTTQGVLEAGIKSAPMGGLSVGAQLAYEGGRASADSDFLKNHQVANLGVSASWGLHAEWDTKLGAAPLNILARYRHEARAERGAQTDLRATIGVYGGAQFKAGLFAQTTWANMKSNRTYYGNNPGVNALPAFTAEAGRVNSSFGLLYSYEATPEWIVQGSLEQKQLASNLRQSPFAQTRSNRSLSLGLVHQF